MIKKKLRKNFRKNCNLTILMKEIDQLLYGFIKKKAFEAYLNDFR